MNLFDLLGGIQPWRLEAACRGEGTADFVIRSEQEHRGLPRRDLDRIARAISICEACPVKEPCLSFAVEMGEFGGVWGGRYISQRGLAELRRARVPGDAA